MQTSANETVPVESGELAASADVIIQAYRPGSLAKYGLGPEQVLERNPGVVYVNLSAWGSSGPWSARRGFDSLVQMATGLAQAIEGDNVTDRPRPLPLQVLDHATGWLAAYAAVAGLTRRLQKGGGSVMGVSLAQTAHWLMRLPAVPKGQRASDARDYLAESRSAFGCVTHVRPLSPWLGVPLPMVPPTGLDDSVSWWDEPT